MIQNEITWLQRSFNLLIMVLQRSPVFSVRNDQIVGNTNIGIKRIGERRERDEYDESVSEQRRPPRIGRRHAWWCDAPSNDPSGKIYRFESLPKGVEWISCTWKRERTLLLCYENVVYVMKKEVVANGECSSGYIKLPFLACEWHTQSFWYYLG